MIAERARVVVRRRGVLDVLDLAVRFVTHHAGPFARLSAWAILPAASLCWALGSQISWWLGWTAAITLGAFAEIPFLLHASQAVFTDSVSTRGIARQTAQHAGGVLGARLLGACAIAMGATFLVLPGFWLAIAFFYVAEVRLLERLPVSAAIVRAQKIASASFGEALAGWVFLLAFQAGAVLVFDLAGRSIVVDLLQFEAPEPLWESGGSLFAMAGFWAFVPFGATARFLLYLDARTRTEGWDVQTRFFAMAQRDLEEEAT